MCVLGCLRFLRDRLYKCFGETHEDIHYENGIVVCDDEDILQNYVHGDLHNDNKSISKDNLGNFRIVWDVYNVDVVSMRLGKDNIGKDEIRDIEDNINNFKMIWDVYNDDVVVKCMVINYKKERKEMIMRTTHAKEGEDPSR